MPVLADSQRTPAPGAHAIGIPGLDSRIEVLISLKSPSGTGSKHFGGKKGKRMKDHISRREVLGNSPAREVYAEAIEIVLQFANEHHLKKVRVCGDYLITFEGSVSDINRAFNTELRSYAYPLGTYMSHENGLEVPENMISYIDAVLGLDTRRIAKPYISASSNLSGPNAGWLEQIREIYALPSLTGEGECIGILEFGGQLSSRDIEHYFDDLSIPQPKVIFTSVSSSSFGSPLSNPREDWEVALDTEVAGSIAPGATIVVYTASNTDAGWVEAICRAVHDNKYRPKVISISWGESELTWPPDTLKTIKRLLQDAAGDRSLGITICAASGDDGCDFDQDGYAQVAFPASSPFVLACGGTTIQNDSTEIVWNDFNGSASGGGISDLWALEQWQDKKLLKGNLPGRKKSDLGRLLPDVAGLAAHRYNVFSKGNYINGLGGTSAAAPLWAGIIALLNQGLMKAKCQRVGYFNPRLYTTSALKNTFRDVFSGTNGSNGIRGYEAQDHWDACTGWGSPNVQKLLAELITESVDAQNRVSPTADAVSLRRRRR